MPYGCRVAPRRDAVSAARRRIVTVLHSWRVPLSEETLRDVELMSSEVITNAVVHTEATCAVAVRWTGRRVRVEVTDASPGQPVVSSSGSDEEHGRGLVLVESLSAAWGTGRVPAGKVVWFEVEPEACKTGMERLSTLVRATVSLASPGPEQPARIQLRIVVLTHDHGQLPRHLLRSG
ncbi:ATP-binding protein [Streptomyces albus]|uniref:ATP-binding protein n=1 Tax=Streptomyces albus TaxID=1888 RepID=UPI00244679F1|nr:ATP-binding protein [Streptomyces albus]